MYKVLIIDDRKDYVLSQIELADFYKIDLEHIDNWEEAKIKIESDFSYYKAVILDGKGKIKKNGKEEDSQHLAVAKKWLDIQRSHGHYIHYVINTGFVEEIREWFCDIPLCSKLGQEEMMFSDIVFLPLSLSRSRSLLFSLLILILILEFI